MRTTAVDVSNWQTDRIWWDVSHWNLWLWYLLDFSLEILWDTFSFSLVIYWSMYITCNVNYTTAKNRPRPFSWFGFSIFIYNNYTLNFKTNPISHSPININHKNNICQVSISLHCVCFRFLFPCNKLRMHCSCNSIFIVPTSQFHIPLIFGINQYSPLCKLKGP